MADDNNSTALIDNSSTATVGLPDAVSDPTRQLAITIQLYFKYAIVAIGVFGTVANALVLYALILHHVRDAKRRAINLLIINQNVLDLLSCMLLLISVSIQINDPYVIGTSGVFLCAVFFNNNATHSALQGSVFNLVALTIERYVKVVHPFWSRNHSKRWMIHASMAFVWSVVVVTTITPFITMAVEVKDGSCLSSASNGEASVTDWIFEIGVLLIFFLLPLIIFVYCYGRIVVVMRRQMRVMAGHNVEGISAQKSAAQAQSKRVKWNIIKTMLMVSVAFIMCFLPNYIYFLVPAYLRQSTNWQLALDPTVFVIYLNVCMNPFIYALKHDGVKSQLACLIVCRKPNQVGDAATATRSVTGRTMETRSTRTAETRL